jgi:hypothetical protein
VQILTNKISWKDLKTKERFLLGFYFVVLIVFKFSHQYHFLFVLLAGLPVFIFFLWANYIFFFKKKSKSFKGNLLKFIFLAYAILIIFIVWGFIFRWPN